ncbi:hypothetical protein AALO_G00055750 [Alosa alosa]|uniref:Glucagon / GIP / secretin / VIP family domain-containing protein n=1 Tax=Alosa alosa TaxID=278164 RepID=A0AAV6HAG1_9TELE|nr:hypothetical protein AALO_G00055750 [Alosa alosa]
MSSCLLPDSGVGAGKGPKLRRLWGASVPQCTSVTAGGDLSECITAPCTGPPEVYTPGVATAFRLPINSQRGEILQVNILESKQGICSKMCLPFWSMFMLMLCAKTLEVVIEDQARHSRWQTLKVEDGHTTYHYLKRHSDGTFTNDLTNQLDLLKAKDFVAWLASTKRESQQKRGLQEDRMKTGELVTLLNQAWEWS